MLIVLEGIDGTGKSTLTSRLAESLGWLGSKEPGSPCVPFCSNIRNQILRDRSLDAMTRELLFHADARVHKEFIATKDNIISDRGLWSHLAYAYGLMKTRKLDYEDYLLLKQLTKRNCAKPDLVIYLDGDIELMNERLAGQEKDVIEEEGSEMFAYTLAQYDDLLKERRRAELPVLSLSARDSLEKNLQRSLDYIRGLM